MQTQPNTPEGAAGMGRRDFLMAAPAVCIPAVVQGAPLSSGDSETPIAALFREWQRLTVAAEDRSLTDDECDAMCDLRSEVERQMNAIPARDAMDVLMKVAAFTAPRRRVIAG
ncbi:hypothetical protein [Pararhodobacter sp.]|uniref:hypothetical protein n=1 Tax=Pararhodobacter sp. TaxID=2127056 RepID=UPI002FDF93EE